MCVMLLLCVSVFVSICAFVSVYDFTLLYSLIARTTGTANEDITTRKNRYVLFTAPSLHTKLPYLLFTGPIPLLDRDPRSNCFIYNLNVSIELILVRSSIT